MSNGAAMPSRVASKRGMRWALLILGLFFVVEAVGAFATGSLALLADAGHLLSDVGSIVLALAAFWLASRPPSESRTYGFYRVEILAALVNGLTLWAIAGYIGFEAYRRLFTTPQVLSGPMLVVAVAGLVAQAVTVLLLRTSARESLNARAAAVHVATDVIQSIGVVATAVLMLVFKWYLADPIASLAIAVLIVYSGGRIIIEASHILMEGTPSHVDLPELQLAMERVSGVKEVHDLHTWSITSGYDAMSAHVVLREGVSAERGQRVLTHLRGLASDRFGIHHVTIQLEEQSLGCPTDHGTRKEPDAGRSA